MSSMNVSLRKDAYEFLKMLKGNEKSFSDVIIELKERRKDDDVMKLFGALKNKSIDWDSRKKRMTEFRESFDKRIEETRKKMERLRNDRAG